MNPEIKFSGNAKKAKPLQLYLGGDSYRCKAKVIQRVVGVPLDDVSCAEALIVVFVLYTAISFPPRIESRRKVTTSIKTISQILW